MADKIRTEDVPTQAIGLAVDAMQTMAESERRAFERRWYDNNFFDDGFHFRYLSRTTGKIVDATEKGIANMPQRAIPKASRQIRGVANLMMAVDPVPVIYPKGVSKDVFTKPDEYAIAVEVSKQVAQKVGKWVENEWKDQSLTIKLIQMLLLTAKQGVSYLQVWPDAVAEKIKMQVYDAFDIYLMGSLDSIYDSPFIIKCTPELIAKIKANEEFDPDETAKINPDNKYASSEIKQAYMNSRYGTGTTSDYGATLILKEAYIKEYIGESNLQQVQAALGEKVSKYKTGDQIIRQVFTAGGIVLKDTYLDIPDYPFVDLRLEPGPIYQVPLIERFIPTNKTLDMLVSRLERYANTMVTGTWITRKGEDFNITNIPGGQKLEYSTTPPVQGQMANVPSFIFQLIDLLNQIIEEQGASTSALNSIPNGVKSGIAIESLKATEYANLKIPTLMLKNTVKVITEKMLDIADNYFMKPQTVYLLDKGEPSYFEIIGQASVDVRQQKGIDVPNAIPISRDYRVDIEVEAGLGYTQEGKKETMQQVVKFMVELAAQGLITQDALKLVVSKFLEVYKFGSTSEFMDAMESGTQTTPLTNDQTMQMKIALVEAMKDVGVVGPEQEQKLVETTKVGTAEALRDMSNPQKAEQPLPVQGQ